MGGSDWGWLRNAGFCGILNVLITATWAHINFWVKVSNFYVFLVIPNFSVFFFFFFFFIKKNQVLCFG